MFDIPAGEFERFNSIMQVYNQGAPILIEGQQDDKGIILLRAGKVGLYKKQGNVKTLIATIDAVNFFGEMAIVSGGPRTVGVEVLSKQAIVYCFRSSDLQMLIANPKWGHMLVSRLALNLKTSNEQMAELLAQNRDLKNEIQTLEDNSAEVLNIMGGVHKSMMSSSVVSAKEWQVLNALTKMVEKLIHIRLPGIKNKLSGVSAAQWKQYHDEGLVPELLYSFILDFLKQGPSK